MMDPIDFDDITEEDHILVEDFYKAACHHQWCEYDEWLLLYVAARSRLNERARVLGCPHPAKCRETGCEKLCMK